MSQPVVFFGGSRECGRSGWFLSRLLARRLAARGARAVVGCARGADQAFASAFPAGRLLVMAAGGPAEPRRERWVDRAEEAGARVRWWAGGRGARVVPRLVRRSLAGVELVAAQERPSAVFVLSSAESPGSLLSARAAAEAGVQVLVFLVGEAVGLSCPPALGERGCWQRGAILGVPAPCWRWRWRASVAEHAWQEQLMGWSGRPERQREAPVLATPWDTVGRSA